MENINNTQGIDIYNFLPFWILGVPLVLAGIELIRTPKSNWKSSYPQGSVA